MSISVQIGQKRSIEMSEELYDRVIHLWMRLYFTPGEIAKQLSSVNDGAYKISRYDVVCIIRHYTGDGK